MPKDKVQKKIKRKRKMLKLFLMAIFISVLVILVSKSKYFNIKSIVVKNNRMVTAEEIQIQAQLEGSNIFFINKKEVKERICTNPYIDDVEIRRSLPSSVIIKIKEKSIKGIVKFQNTFMNIDSEGRMIQTVSKFPDGSIPMVLGVDIKQYVPNEYVFEDDPIKQKALKSALAVTDYEEYKGIISGINASDPYNITFTTKQGIDIKIGNDSDIDYKLSYAFSILNNPSIAGSKGYIQIQPDGTAIFNKIAGGKANEKN